MAAVAGLQAHCGRKHAPIWVLLKQAGAVAQGQFCGRQRALGKVAVQKGHAFQHVLHLAAIGTGIHIHGPADGAGDAAGKGKACKALLLGNGAKPPQREASARSKAGGAVRLWFRCRAEVQPAQIYDCAVVALIGKQRVGAVAQKVGAHTVFPAKHQRAAQLVHGFGRAPEHRRAADLESGMGCQRLLLGKRQGAFLQGLTQGFDRLLLHGSSR